MAVPGRSASVQGAVATVASKLGPSASIPVDRLLAALVNPHMARCGFDSRTAHSVRACVAS